MEDTKKNNTNPDSQNNNGKKTRKQPDKTKDEKWTGQSKRNTRVNAKTIFNADIKEDVGGGFGFEKNDTNTRTTQENGEFRVNRGDDTMQPRDDDGKFAEVSLVGRVPKYDHPGHKYKGSNYMEDIRQKLDKKAIEERMNEILNFGAIDKVEESKRVQKFKDLLNEHFGIRQGGRFEDGGVVSHAIAERDYDEDVDDVTYNQDEDVEVGEGAGKYRAKRQTGWATYAQNQMGGGVGQWADENFKEALIDNFQANLTHYMLRGGETSKSVLTPEEKATAFERSGSKYDIGSLPTFTSKQDGTAQFTANKQMATHLPDSLKKQLSSLLKKTGISREEATDINRGFSETAQPLQKNKLGRESSYSSTPRPGEQAQPTSKPKMEEAPVPTFYPPQGGIPKGKGVPKGFPVDKNSWNRTFRREDQERIVNEYNEYRKKNGLDPYDVNTFIRLYGSRV